MQWISRALAVAIHDRQLAEHGGSSGVRDENLLASALSRPQQTERYAEPAATVHQLAASLAYGLARNHPFVDGNKRTAYVCCRTFLVLNGCEMAGTPEQRYLNILALAEGRLSEADFARLIDPDHASQSGVYDAGSAYNPQT